MRRSIFIGAFAALLLVAPTSFAQATPDEIAAALADTTRPEKDREADARRHPAELLAFTGVKAGDTVVDWVPGSGYFTRPFSTIVGDSGKVYAWAQTEFADSHDIGKAANALAAERKNVTAVIVPFAEAPPIQNADVVWTSQNYHDLYAEFMKGPDVAAFNKQIFDMLKPGGVYVIVDHAAKAGSGHEAGETLHRIDPALVKSEVEAAGFVFEGESNVLANPEDTHELMVFDEKIRGKTDQFVYKFRKPAA
jgi:predicted methyltransferase